MTRYRTIVADPPWEYGRDSRGAYSWRAGRPSGETRFRQRDPYTTMTAEEIGGLDVGALADADAHLYLWTTQRYLPHAFGIVSSWGFAYAATLVWCKEPRGFNVGGVFASTTEFVLFARRGNLPALSRAQRQWFVWKRGEHSAKPDAFLDLVEQVSPGPYLELFARRQRLGWDTWGDEALNHVELSA